MALAACRADTSIDGPSPLALNGKRFETVDPSNGTVLTAIAPGDAADIDLGVTAAPPALDDERWLRRSHAEHEAVLLGSADPIEWSAEEFALLDSLEAPQLARVDQPAGCV